MHCCALLAVSHLMPVRSLSCAFFSPSPLFLFCFSAFSFLFLSCVFIRLSCVSPFLFAQLHVCVLHFRKQPFFPLFHDCAIQDQFLFASLHDYAITIRRGVTPKKKKTKKSKKKKKDTVCSRFGVCSACAIAELRSVKLGFPCSFFFFSTL